MAKDPKGVADTFRALNSSLKQGISATTMAAIGQLAVTTILLRTKRGLDAALHPFKSYSPSYADYRSRRSLQTGHVDLAVTGHMLGSMQVENTGPNEVTVGFGSPLEATKAYAHNEGRGVPQREFLDIQSDTELDMIAELVGEELVSRFGRL